MRKIKYPRIGEYVLATQYADKDPNDPWFVGHIACICYYGDNYYTYKLQEDVSHRQYNYVFKITQEEGAEWLNTTVDTL
jgi:hypothetical protein